MKVLIIHNHYRPPSGENVVFNNERELLLRNNVEVATYERSNEEIDRFSKTKKLLLALTVPWSAHSYREVGKVIQRTRPEIVHVHNTFPLISPSVFKACQDHGVPVVQTLHNYRWICPGAMLTRNKRPCEECIGRNLMPALRNRCYYNSLKQTAVICWMIMNKRRRERDGSLVNRYIVLTEFAASRLKRGGIPDDKITIKPNFLSVAPVQGGEKEKYAVYAGLLNEEKGLHTLLDAWKRLNDIPLKIFGDGPLRKELEKQAVNNSINVEFYGYRKHDEVLSAIRKAALQIIPSELYENFPMTVLEAFSSGTPLVASRIGSLAEIINDGKTGLLFEPGNAADLAEKVRLLLGNNELVWRITSNGLSVFKSKYSAERNFDMLMDIYGKVISERAKSKTVARRL